MAERPQKIAEFIELPSPEQRLNLACEYTARHVERGETVALYAPDPADAGDLDGLLWTFRQNSFIPHVRFEEAEEPLIEPAVIYGDPPAEGAADVLVLLSIEGVPDWPQRYAHVFDFAPLYDDGLRQAARQRFAALKDAGYRMRFIKADAEA